MYIWSKNLSKKMPKRAILAIEWGFERSLISDDKIKERALNAISYTNADRK